MFFDYPPMGGMGRFNPSNYDVSNAKYVTKQKAPGDSDMTIVRYYGTLADIKVGDLRGADLKLYKINLEELDIDEVLLMKKEEEFISQKERDRAEFERLKKKYGWD